MEVSINQLIEMTGKNHNTIKKLIAGLKPTSTDNRGSYYECKEALRCIYGLKEIDQENLLLERAKRKMAEIELAQITGELVTIESVVKIIDRQFSYIRSHIRSLPSKLAKVLANTSDPHEVHSLLQEAIDECLSELKADATFKQQQLERDKLRAQSVAESDSQPSSDSQTEPS